MENKTFLGKIDAFMSGKKTNEVYGIFLVVFILIGLLVYSYVFPISQEYVDTNTNKLNNVVQNVNEKEAYIRAYAPEIGLLDNKIKSQSIALSNTRDINGYVDNKLKELSYLLFNDKSWTGFIDRVSFLAKKHNIRIDKISNEFMDTKNQTREKVEQVLNIEVTSSSGFQNTMKFLNDIEDNQLVVDVYDVSLVASQKVDSNIKIALWGMLYWKHTYFYLLF